MKSVATDKVFTSGLFLSAILLLPITSNANSVRDICSPCSSWKNHGEYVRCVSQAVEEQVSSGMLTEEQGDAVISFEARSSIGKKDYVSNWPCPAPSNCVTHYFEDSIYLICQGEMNFDEASAECNSYGMSLSTIDSKSENTSLIDAALEAFGCTSYQETSYWIANLKSNTSDDSVWASEAGEPSGDGNNIHIMRYCGAPYSDPYGWNDASASYKWGWVCETKL